MKKTTKKLVKEVIKKTQLPGQLGRIVDYLKEKKSATGLDLWRNCGSMSWAKKISELNQILPPMGYEIQKQRVQVYSKFAKKEVWVMEYALVKINSKKKRK